MGGLALHVFGSGSKGNCSAVVDNANGNSILLDCGITFKALDERSRATGFDLSSVRAVLVTHEHTDHTRGIGVMLRALAKRNIVPVLLCNEPTFLASPELQALADAGVHDVRMFKMSDELKFGDIRVHPFHTSHDAACPCGFRFELHADASHEALGFMTDTGIVTEEAHEALADVRILALESNHDPVLLRQTPYPVYVQKRIAGDTGHLSNLQSARELESLLSERLEHVVCMHISQNSNTYVLPEHVLSRALRQAGHHARVCAAYQNTPVSVG